MTTDPDITPSKRDLHDADGPGRMKLSAVNLAFPSWFTPFNTAYKISRPTSEAKLRRINGG